MNVRWVAFPLHPETPEDGRSLEELFQGRVDLEQMMDRLKKTADELGLPLGERTKTYNSRLAQELSKWVESLGKGDEYHNAVFRAYFVDGTNIARICRLAELASELGLDERKARDVLEQRTCKAEVDLDWSRARAMGVTAVPTFVVDRHAVVGAQPLEVLEELMRAGNVKKRTW